MGAEPDRIDEGPHAGLRLFEEEEMLGLRLMQSLPAGLQEKAALSQSVERDGFAGRSVESFR